MATVSLILPIAAAYLPDDSASNAAAQLQIKTSSAGTPKPRWVEALFDASTDEHIMWAFVMPNDYSSAPVLKVHYKMASATSGNVVWGAVVMAVSDGDAQDVDADTFDSANTATVTVPGTAGYLNVASITMTNADSVAAGDTVIVCLYRDADNASDTATGDAEAVNAELQYSTA